eukprot:2101248-Rhodomonas_salina.2
MSRVKLLANHVQAGNFRIQQATCPLCPAGQYQPNQGSTTCYIASPGFGVHINLKTHQYVCSADASPGFFVSLNDKTRQQECTEEGQYQSSPGQTSCKVCTDCNFGISTNCTADSDNGYFFSQSSCTACKTTTTDATSVNSHPCEPTQIWQAGSCSASNDDVCLQVPANAVANGGAMFACQAGYFWQGGACSQCLENCPSGKMLLAMCDGTRDNKCIDCPVGGICDDSNQALGYTCNDPLKYPFADKGCVVAGSQMCPVGTVKQGVTSLHGLPRSSQFVMEQSRACLIVAHDVVMCWDGHDGNKKTTIDLGGFSVLALAAGDAHTCALLNTFQVKCWGGNDKGQLGATALTGYTTSTAYLVNVGHGISVVSISAGGKVTCVVTTDFRAKCWGDNAQGQLGQQRDAATLLPSQVPPIYLGQGVRVQKVVAGREACCALVHSPSGVPGVKCWGQGGFLGYGDTVSRGVFVGTESTSRMGDFLPYVDLGLDDSVQQLEWVVDITRVTRNGWCVVTSLGKRCNTITNSS